MEILLNLAMGNPQQALVNIAIILFIILCVVSGWKQGFLESSVRFIGTILAIILAYILKTPLASFMYSRLPFFKLGGIFQGVTTINILIYDIIAFIIVLSALLIILKVIARLTGLVDKVLSFIFLFGIPNKILGAIVGFIQSLILIYFAFSGVKFVASICGFSMQPTLADDIMQIPVLKATFGKTMDSFDEINSLATNYKSINSKDEYNYESLKILMEKNIISCDTIKYMKENGKLDIENIDTLLNKCK